MPKRNDNTRSDAGQGARRPDYRIQSQEARVVSYGRNIKIQELSDDRWAVFIKSGDPIGYYNPSGGSYFPTGPIHSSPTHAKRYLRGLGV
jgi:hypothetical protein